MKQKDNLGSMTMAFGVVERDDEECSDSVPFVLLSERGCDHV